MEFDLVFCIDGVLRIRPMDGSPALSLSFIQKQEIPIQNDLAFLSDWWEKSVYFEKGLTIGAFLKCLEPWQNFWADYIGKDIPAHIAESKKPVLVKEDPEALSYACLYYYTQISPEYGFEESEDEEDLNVWLNQTHKEKLTGKWEIYGNYKLSGYREGIEQAYCIDYVPMNEMSNLPLVLDPSQHVCFFDYKSVELLGEEKRLLNLNAYGLRQEGDKNSERSMLRYVEGNKTHHLREVVEGFFWWIPGSPARREEMNQSLLARSEQYHEEEELNQELESEAGTEDQVRKISFLPGAFSGLIEAQERRESFYEKMYRKAQKSHETIIRIGKIDTSTYAEKRVISKIVEDKDLSTPYLDNPQQKSLALDDEQ